MNPTKRLVSPAMFAGVVVAFFMSFATVSCEGQALATFSGIQLVTGTTVEADGQSHRTDPNLLAVLALVAAVVGFGAGVQRPGAPRVTAVTAAAGAFCLLLLKWRLESAVAREGEGLFRVVWESGYWIALGLFLGAVLFNARTALSSGTVPARSDASQAGT